jgi:isochorismate synthase
MTQPSEQLVRKLDALIRRGACLALHRLPWADECHLTLQTGPGAPILLPDIPALGGQKGFVMAPFAPSAQTPILCIRPDITACGWQEMEERLPEVDDTTSDDREADDDDREAAADDREAAAPSRYEEAFGVFIEALRGGTFRKLVLSRSQRQSLPGDFSPTAAFVRACRAYPRMMIYLCHTPASGTWMGSTPEILLSGGGREWTTVALAGTMPASDAHDDASREPGRWSPKNREEQALVAEYLRDVLRPHCSEVHEEGPYTARAGQLFHLKTEFTFVPRAPQGIGHLLQALHPTPAVCGLPKAPAQAFILRHEGYDRRYYTGFVGWLNPLGASHLYVNLRCMQWDGRRQATLYAGGGLLPSSECRREWDETTEKMKTMKEIL